MKYRNLLRKTWRGIKISLFWLALAFGVGSSFVGCANKDVAPPEPIIVYKTVTVYKEVKPHRDTIYCDFNGTGIVPGQKLVDCLGVYIHKYNSVTTTDVYNTDITTTTPLTK